MDAISQLNIGLTGRYEIEREIGAGGMATVYLARDLRHSRRVAVKVLKPELGAILGAERFLSEIRITANLQHPNLLPLFDSGESGGLLYYVMPYVEGESLRQRLEREKQLPLGDVERLMVAMCRALDYAHRHGVIHRDLKPENVLLHDGQPLIADFGIALAISNAAGVRLTQSGMAVGTPQYMSPEQAAGDRVIDARSDIYVAGALAYEMLAGETPHTGRTAQAIISKLMTEEPRPVSSLRPSVPAYLDAVVHRALQKLPADRFATAQEMADALSAKTHVVQPRATGTRPSLWRIGTPVAAALCAATAAWLMKPLADSDRPMRFSLALPDSAAIDPSSFYRSLDLSPNGTELVYVGTNGLFVRRLNDLTPRRLTTEIGRDPRFSPDGSWVAYIANAELRKVPIGGGQPIKIVDSVGRYGWGPRGTIVFTRSGRSTADLWRVHENGGRPVRFVHQRRHSDFAYGSPTFLPDGDTFLIPIADSVNNFTEIAAYRFSDDSMRYLGVHGDHPLYVPDGVLLYVDNDASVYAIALNTRSLSVGPRATRVFDGVLKKESAAELALSASGMMAYFPAAPSMELIEYDRTGRPHGLGLPVRQYGGPRYSPKGSRIAAAVRNGSSSDIVIYDLNNGRPRQITTNGHSYTPEWTRDGGRIAWTEIEGGIGRRIEELRTSRIVWRAADGGDSVTMLVPDGLGMAFSPTADVGVALVRGGVSVMLTMIEQLASAMHQTPISDIRTSGPTAARISPDGHWIAYQSSFPNRDVYVRRLPAGASYQVSVGGGGEPMWNPRGGELFYRAGQRLVAVALSLGSEPRMSRPDTLPFLIETRPGGVWSTYDVSGNGERFLLGRPTARNDQPIVITRWVDEVRDKLRVSR